MATPPRSDPRLITDTARAAFAGHLVELAVSDEQKQALILHRAGLNVFPLPRGSKTPIFPPPPNLYYKYQWKRFRTARLHAADLPVAFSGEPVNIAVLTGRTSGHLVVFDMESQDAFTDVMSAVSRADLPLWAVRTARGGHVYLRCLDGELANQTISTDNGTLALEIRGNGGYVLGPGSVHPTGVIYDFERQESDEPPAISFDHLRTIFPDYNLSLSTYAYQSRSNPSAQVSANTITLLRGGTPEGFRNPQVYTSTRELLARGYNEDHTADLILAGAQAAGLERREIERTIQNAVKAHRHHHPDPGRTRRRPPMTSAIWNRALEWTQDQPWPGRAGSTDLQAFRAHCERLRMEHPDTQPGTPVSWRCSVREGAELASMSRTTFNTATHRLQAAGFLRLTTRDTNGWRYTFGQAVHLTVPASATHHHPTTNERLFTRHPAFGRVRVTTGENPDTGQPTYEYRGLGSNAAVVLRHLLQHGPCHQSQLARRVPALTRQKARTALQRLQTWQLIRQAGTRGRATLYAANVTQDVLLSRLDEIAALSGTLRAAQERRVQHHRERQAGLLDVVLRARYLKGRED